MRGAGGIPSVPTVSQTARALILISVMPSRYVSRVYFNCTVYQHLVLVLEV